MYFGPREIGSCYLASVNYLQASNVKDFLPECDKGSELQLAAVSEAEMSDMSQYSLLFQ